jgi:hypothetical protein
VNLGSSIRVSVLALAGAMLVTLTPLESPLSPLPVGPAPVSAASACTDGWREIKLPVAFEPRYLLAAVSNSIGPKWLVGGSHNDGQLVYQKTNGAWKRINVPSGGTKGLTGGSPITNRKVALSGYKNSPQAGITGKIAKNKWTAGETRPGTNTLTGTVVSKGKTWVVGTRVSGNRLRATVRQKSKKGWRRYDPPTANVESALTAVDATPGGTIWTVGWQQVAKKWRRPYVARRVNGRWKVSTPAPITNGEAVLTDVHVDSAKSIWSTGYSIPRGDSNYRPILQRWDGSRWRNVSVPFANGRSLIARAVVTDDAGTLWLAGAQLAKGDRNVRGWAANRTNGVWQFRTLNTPPELPSELRSLAPSSVGAVAVGSVKSTMLAMEACRPAIAGAKSKISVSDLNKRRSVPIGEDDAYDIYEDAPSGFSIAGKPPGFGTPTVRSTWKVKNVSSEYDMEKSVRTWDGFVHDFDGNGWDDFFYSRHLTLKPRVYLASKNGLTRPSGDGFTVVDRHGCDAADIDGNGLADIYCATGKVRGTATGRHELSMNVTGPGAEVLKGSLGAADPLGRGRYVTFIDYDSDGDDDLFIANGKRRVDALPRGNRFYKNTGGRFIPAPQVGLDSTVGSRCLWSGDIDRDGDEDLLSCVIDPLDGRRTGVRFYRNEKGKLVERSANRSIAPMGDIDVAVADVTGDKRPDLIQLSPTRLRVSRQTNNGFVKIFERSTTDAVAIAVGDVNKDGLADIYVLRGGKTKNKQDYLLVAKDNGRAFKPVSIPQTSKGEADDVLALVFDHNGRTDFVVLNGASKPGPVLLLATVPRS